MKSYINFIYLNIIIFLKKKVLIIQVKFYNVKGYNIKIIFNFIFNFLLRYHIKNIKSNFI